MHLGLRRRNNEGRVRNPALAHNKGKGSLRVTGASGRKHHCLYLQKGRLRGQRVFWSGL